MNKILKIFAVLAFAFAVLFTAAAPTPAKPSVSAESANRVTVSATGDRVETRSISIEKNSTVNPEARVFAANLTSARETQYVTQRGRYYFDVTARAIRMPRKLSNYRKTVVNTPLLPPNRASFAIYNSFHSAADKFSDRRRKTFV